MPSVIHNDDITLNITIFVELVLAMNAVSMRVAFRQELEVIVDEENR